MEEELDKMVRSTKHVLILLYAGRRHLVSVKKIRTHCTEGVNINFKTPKSAPGILSAVLVPNLKEMDIE